jgi:HemX protein
MKTISQSISIILPTIYLLVIVMYGILFFTKNKKLERITPFLLFGLVVVHGLEIFSRGLALHAIPLSSMFDALSFLAFSILIVYVIIELSVKNKATGFIVLMLPFLLQIMSSILYQWDLSSNPLLSNPIFAVHASLTVIGYTGLCISALYALMYTMLNHNIKRRRLGIIYENLPPLDLLEKLSIRSISIGIVALGIGLLLGHFRSSAVFGNFLLNDPKVIFSDILWFCYFCGYVLSRIARWRGRWMALLSMVGFLLLLIVNFSLFFIFNSFHQFN